MKNRKKSLKFYQKIKKMNSLKWFKIIGQRRQLCLKKRIYKKKNEKNKKKALTKKEVFDSIYLVDGKKLGKRTMKIEEEANAKKR